MALDDAFPTAATALETMTQWEAFFVGLGVGTGVVGGLNGELAPSINSGARTVSLGSGAAVLRGFYVNNAATTTIGVPTQDAQNRVDRLVLRLDRTAVTAAAWITPVIIEGTAGTTNPPAIQATTTGAWDLPICRWTTASNGTLSGLVDERYTLGSTLTQFPSTARPSASPPRMGREKDTGRLLVADGSQWNPVVDDSGWVDLTPDTNFWTQGLFDLKVRRLGGWVHLRGSVERHQDKLQESDTYSHVLTIPSGYRPATSHLYTAWVTGGIFALVRVYPTGDLALTAHAVDGISVNHDVYLDTTWSLG